MNNAMSFFRLRLMSSKCAPAPASTTARVNCFPPDPKPESSETQRFIRPGAAHEDAGAKDAMPKMDQRSAGFIERSDDWPAG